MATILKNILRSTEKGVLLHDAVVRFAKFSFLKLLKNVVHLFTPKLGARQLALRRHYIYQKSLQAHTLVHISIQLYMYCIQP